MLPALAASAWILFWSGQGYYRPVYPWVSLAFAFTSFSLGLFHAHHPGAGVRFAGRWLLLFGLLAWLTALACLALLNMTPLCIGQDNGDGINNLGLCTLYTLLAAVFYSPPVLLLEGMSRVPGRQADRSPWTGNSWSLQMGKKINRGGRFGLHARPKPATSPDIRMPAQLGWVYRLFSRSLRMALAQRLTRVGCPAGSWQ